MWNALWRQANRSGRIPEMLIRYTNLLLHEAHFLIGVL